MIFWFTGQPGSGKTTLGKALLEKLDDVFHIDGDDLRGLSANVDYSEQGRINNIRTAQSIAMYLDNKLKPSSPSSHQRVKQYKSCRSSHLQKDCSK